MGMLNALTTIRADFQANYGALLDEILKQELALTVCTIYDAIPGLQDIQVTALSIFNDAIITQATQRKLHIIELRHICTDSGDYSALSPIEPSEQGGGKIANTILKVHNDHNSKAPGNSRVYL